MNEPTTALTLPEPDQVRRSLQAIKTFQAIVHLELVDGHDFGTIPGTQSPTLLKPGAEKLISILGLVDDYEIIDKVLDWEKPLFHFSLRCCLRSLDGQLIRTGVGECNSMEAKYRWRWVEALSPGMIATAERVTTLSEFAFAIKRAETTGKYGKPEAYWREWERAIAAGAAKRVSRPMSNGRTGEAWERTGKLYRIENDDIFTQVNTILKMAKKRALVDAALSVGRLSDIFTQDLDDIMAGTEPATATVFEGEITNMGAESGNASGENFHRNRDGEGVPPMAVPSAGSEETSSAPEDDPNEIIALTVSTKGDFRAFAASLGLATEKALLQAMQFGDMRALDATYGTDWQAAAVWLEKKMRGLPRP